MLVLLMLLVISCSSEWQDSEETEWVVVGERVSLPCLVNTTHCGEYHSLKWYKDNVRVGVYSPAKDWYRVEAGLVGVQGLEVQADEVEVSLGWEVGGEGEEGTYKCEITYLATSACPVVRLISRLVVVTPPTSVHLYTERGDGGVLVTNSTLGPLTEGDLVRLRCVSSGGRPPPQLYWYLGDTLVTSPSLTTRLTVSTTLPLNITRSLLNKRITCKAANRAMETTVMTASVEIDLNLGPVSTVITPEQDREELVSGDTLQLLCQTEGARPAATIRWFNGTDGSLIEHSHHQIATLQSDGTYVTLSKLMVRTRYWHHGNTLTCASSETTKDKYVINVLYPPVITIKPRTMTVTEGSNASIVCEYHSNPPDLINIEVYQDSHQREVLTEVSGGAVVVTLVNVTAREQGEFSCVLANIIGQGRTSQYSQLTVVTAPLVRLGVAGRRSDRVRLLESSMDNLTLSCSVHHSHRTRHSLHSVQWFMDDILLHSLPNCEDPGSNLCDIDPTILLLENVNRYFHGNFSCIGFLSNGLSSGMSNTVSVSVLFPPGQASITASTKRVLYSGDRVTFTCSLADLGRPTVAGYRWILGGQEVLGERSARLSLTVSDSQGNVSCLGYNQAGAGPEGTFNLSVMTGPVLVQSLPPLTSVLDTEQLSLVCQVRCNPGCHLRWYREGRLVRQGDPRYTVNNTISYQNNRKYYRSALQFNPSEGAGRKVSRQEDNVEFSCQSTSNCLHNLTSHCLGVSSSTLVSLQFPPTNISLSRETVELVEFSPFTTLYCKAEGSPLPTYRWLHNTTVLSTQPSLSVGREVRREQAGLYTCQASNMHGTVAAQAVIRVLHPPSCRLERLPEEDEGLARLGCILVTGEPRESNISWLGKEGERQNQSVITVTTRSSPQSVRCRVSNSVGRGECQISLAPTTPLLPSSSALVLTLTIPAILSILATTLAIIFCLRKFGSSNGKYFVSGRSR